MGFVWICCDSFASDLPLVYVYGIYIYIILIKQYRPCLFGTAFYPDSACYQAARCSTGTNHVTVKPIPKSEVFDLLTYLEQLKLNPKGAARLFSHCSNRIL